VTRGFAVGAVASLVLSLIPKRTATTTSAGWLLFRLPWAGHDVARQMEAAPMIGRAVEAAQAGDLATAERTAAELRETYPDLRCALAARISVLEAQGRYAEAMILAVKLTSDATTDPQQASSYAALAGLACATVEAGQLDAEVGLTTASQAIENAATLGYPNHKLNGARAMVELLRGNLKEAITLARHAAGTGDDLLTRADDLATLARAHMAAGDNRAAREVIGEAEKLAKWWPRVANTRTRLEVAG
jgi:ATP/maltotriose-dependent transcriptional regulator MalT